MTLDLRPQDECAFDVVSLGEVMLRLDPGEGRIRSARSFTPWEGGGEYNVTRGLRACFGLRGAVMTGLVDNEVGRLVENLILAGGVDTRFISWTPFDGLGREARNGLNFTERGFGVRGALGVSDRGHTAASQLTTADLDLDHLFGTLGVRWLHTGGIFAGLSETSAQTAIDVVQAARAHGTVVSFDVNYRPSLWAAVGGPARAREVTREIAQHVDVLIGSLSEDDLGGSETEQFERMAGRAAEEFPGLRVVGDTLRTVHSASRNEWGTLAWSRDTGVVRSTIRELEILDRIGGGDSFAAGLIYGLLADESLQRAVELGAAHGALVMTTPGDNSMATLAEVLNLAGGGTAGVDR